MNMKSMDIYDVMEEKLKDDSISLKEIKLLGKELIEKMKMIDKEINIINPNRVKWNELAEDNKNKLMVLYKLKDQYRNQFDIISVILNKNNDIVNIFTRNKIKEAGLDDKFIIENLEED